MLSSQLLREDLPRLLENIIFKKTSIFVNFDLLQTVYLATLLFRAFNGEYLKNNEFVVTFLEVYDENLAKRISETHPCSAVEALKDKISVFGLIKNRIGSCESKDKEIFSVLRPWTDLVLEDCRQIMKNKHLCL
jgi:hypothetical protein